mgnify:CR=1 FL=1
MTIAQTPTHPAALGYLRSASTGAFSTLILFAVCWLGVFVGLPLVFSHAFAGLFTLEPMGSLSSLLIGGLSAFISGAFGGAIIAHCYNLYGRWFGE